MHTLHPPSNPMSDSSTPRHIHYVRAHFPCFWTRTCGKIKQMDISRNHMSSVWLNCIVRIKNSRWRIQTHLLGWNLNRFLHLFRCFNVEGQVEVNFLRVCHWTTTRRLQLQRSRAGNTKINVSFSRSIEKLNVLLKIQTDFRPFEDQSADGFISTSWST